MVTIEWANNPIYVDETNQAINLIVKFVEFSNPLPFTATSYDSEDYGRQIYYNALNGDYGVIAPYVPPTSIETAENQPIVEGVQTL